MKGQHSATPRRNGRHAPRLSDTQKWKRAALRLDRLAEQMASVTDEGTEPGGMDPDDDPVAWLDALSPLARAEGLHELEAGLMPGDRDAWQAFLEHRADWIRKYPLRNCYDLAEKERHHSKGVILLEAVKYRWR
jgi:hypothetical protein